MSISHNSLLTNTPYLYLETAKYDRRCDLPFTSQHTGAYIPSAISGALPEVSLKLLQDLKKDIRNHFEYRIQIFFQQMILLYKSQLIFKLYERAVIQVGVCPPNGKRQYAAAHSSTLPTLLLNQEGFCPFAKGSYFFYSWNATVLLPKAVNNVDELFDKHSFPKYGSTKSIATNILNAVSSGQINPERGLNEFLNLISNIICKLEESQSENELSSFVLEQYKAVVLSYNEYFKKGELIPLLCWMPNSKEPLETIFMLQQKKMHKVLREEMEALAPIKEDPYQIPRKSNLEYAQTLLETVSKDNLSLALASRAQTSVSNCLMLMQIRNAALRYLCETSADTLKTDLTLNQADKIGPIAKGVSSAAQDLHDLIARKIKDLTNALSIKNMKGIFLNCLMAVAGVEKKKAVAEEEKKEKQGLTPRRSLRLERKRIQAQVKVAEETPLRLPQTTATIKKYVALCFQNQVVRQELKLYLSQTDEKTFKEDYIILSNIGRKQSAAVAKLGLSTQAHRVYLISLNIIHADKKKYPTTMGDVMMTLLQNR